MTLSNMKITKLKRIKDFSYELKNFCTMIVRGNMARHRFVNYNLLTKTTKLHFHYNFSNNFLKNFC